MQLLTLNACYKFFDILKTTNALRFVLITKLIDIRIFPSKNVMCTKHSKVSWTIK